MSKIPHLLEDIEAEEGPDDERLYHILVHLENMPLGWDDVSSPVISIADAAGMGMVPLAGEGAKEFAEYCAEEID